MTGVRCRHGVLCMVLLVVMTTHISIARPIAVCQEKCGSQRTQLTQSYYSSSYISRRYSGCMKDCLDDEEEDEEDEDEEDENEINSEEKWRARVTVPPQQYSTTTRWPYYQKKTYTPYQRQTIPPYQRQTFPPYQRQTYPPRPRQTYPSNQRQTYPSGGNHQANKTPDVYRPPPPPFLRSTPSPYQRTTQHRQNGHVSNRGCGVSRGPGNRIIGGLPAPGCEFPWMVGVEVASRYFCGGSIIDKRHVLTAAHCLKNLIPGNPGVVPPSSVKVKYGSSKLSQMKTIGAARIHVNPKYDYYKRDYDVAVVTLERDLMYDTCVGPICLPNVGQDPYQMDECVTTGWGITDSTMRNRRKPDTLQKVTLPLVPRDVCNNVWRQTFQMVVNDLKICAGVLGVGGKDSCLGDSGGPLMCRNGKGPFTEFGIVSFGRKCAEPDWPGVYTNVANSEILQYITSSPKDISTFSSSNSRGLGYKNWFNYSWV